MDGLLYNFNQTVNNVLDPLMDPNIRSVLLLFLMLYGGLAAPSLPPTWKRSFDSIYFRVIMLALIIWITNRDPAIGIAAAIVFIVVLNVAGGKGVFERFENFEGPTTAIYPGCLNMTVYDLLESFKNDKAALFNAMLVARVPGDVKLTDYYSPLIATYLLNKGFTLKSPCTPPGVEQRMGSWM